MWKISKIKILIILVVLIGAVCSLFYFFFKRENKPEIIPISKVRTFYNPNVKLGETFGIAARNGEIFISDGEAGKIWRVSSSLKDFYVLSDKFNTPSAIAFDSNGDLVVADSGSHTIKRVRIQNGDTETIAGVENKFGFQDGDVKTALFNAPIGVAVGADGKIFVADTYNDKIRVVENGQVSTVAGSVEGFADGAGNEAKFDTPCGIAILKNGNLIVADSKNRRLRLIETDGKSSTIAGNGEQNSVDGFPLSASFVEPLAITVNVSGVIYVADGNSIRVINRRFFPFVETISDTKRGFTDGDLRSSRFNRPSGLATDEAGNLFVADAENQAVRVLTGAEIGKQITSDEIKNLRPSPEEFRNQSPPRWAFNPPDAARDIAGTLGEIRGEISDNGKPSWFHNGLDIAGSYGETARFIRTEKVLRPTSVENFATLRELIRLPMLGYIHVRLGRDRDNKIFGDARFQFSFDENRKLNGVRVPRGAKFEAGEAVGTLNAMNHVHLIAGASGAEMNALDALVLPNISDTIAPIIEKVSLFDENWREFETESSNRHIKLSGKTRIVIRAFDRMNGNGGNRKLGVYRLGFQILEADKTPISEINWSILFDRLPDADAVNLVYARGSQSGYT
ncbi:MAG: hypothetical protein M3033_08215, partial [Acidobacteriota bacterium]|nr:hypothetical protein [Acidobacteriota bacterium]